MKDDVCYVIGSGPSLTGFPFDRLPQGYRIGANKSGWLASCDTLVTIDKNFHANFAREIEAFPGEVIAALETPCPKLKDVTYWRRERSENFSFNAGRLAGLNSGQAALNLAYLKGFREIALLGFDFQWTDSRSHFHDGYPGTSRHADQQLKMWALVFSDIADTLNTCGAHVTNFTGPQGSAITAFKTAPLEQLL